jgi:hypothetical protein
MNMYFASTHADFFYLHYLGVISAIKTQQVDKIVLICTVPPEGYYADKLKGLVEFQQFTIDDFSQFRHATSQLKAAHSKDYIQWVTLLANGGIFADLDTISINSLSGLLGSFDVIASPRYLPTFFSQVSYESAVVVAKKNSVVVNDTLRFALQALNGNEPKYQTTGPIAYTKAINLHKNVVGFPGLDVLSPRIKPLLKGLQNRYVPVWDNIPVPSNCYILHIFASTADLTKIDKDWVAVSNTMYAKAIKQVLTRDEWYV